MSKTDVKAPEQVPLRRGLETSHPTVPDISVVPPQEGRRRRFTGMTLVVLAGLIVLGLTWVRHQRAAAVPTGQAGRARLGSLPVPVVAGTVTSEDFPIYLDGLGTVQAFNTVTIRSRVDGQLQRLFFTEGQDVRQGNMLAQIDPAPFQAVLEQTIAKKAQDEAQLTVAQLNLKRDADLLTNNIVAQQDYDTQSALVKQLQATVQADQAAIDNSQVQLAYTKITAPLDGRVGIRLVDEGNIVHANDANGIVVITQVRPISVVFTVAEQQLGVIQQHVAAGETLTVLAVDQNNKTTLSEGKLAVVDNEIDSTTGTIRLKANFSNNDLRLWPGQFVNARMLLTVQKGALVVPAQVVQRGPEDTAFAFVIKPDSTVAVQPVKVAAVEKDKAWIEEGLRLGENVVVDGQYKLQPGSHVKVGENAAPGGPAGRSGARAKTRPAKSAL
jgi:membrane fusion protein, multidrug efflux system